MGHPEMAPQLQGIRDEFANPEEINDSFKTAPSKRLELLIPEYQKPLFGKRAVQAVGIQNSREACPHFNEWLTKLEAIAHKDK